MSFHYRHRKIIIICIALLLFLSSISFFVYKKSFKKKSVKSKNTKVVIEKKKSITKNVETPREFIKVDIKGQIVSPGIYELEKESRVIDVINKAGGLTEFADTTVINLSKKIKDEMVIIIYSKEEVADFKKTKEIEKQVSNKCIRKDSDSLVNDACIEDSDTTGTNSSLVNINTALVDELKTLPGIGESKAKNIIDYRNSNGPFQSIEDLKNVDGIGDGLYDQIKENITIE